MERWVNIYEDESGRFMSDEDYPTWNDAYNARDLAGTYVETVRILTRREAGEPCFSLIESLCEN